MKRKFYIGRAKSGNTKQWKHEKLALDDVIDWLEDYETKDITLKEIKLYNKSKKIKPADRTKKQANAFEKGNAMKMATPCFCGGRFKGKRSPQNFSRRSIIALDIDEQVNLKKLKKEVPYSFYYYETFTSTDEQRKYRLLFFLDADVMPEHFEPVTRKLASYCDINKVDRVSYRINQLMYKPSYSKEVKKPRMGWSIKGKSKLVDLDEIMAQFDDIENVHEWDLNDFESAPYGSHHGDLPDPTEKPGPIGIFCQAYNIHEAIDTYLGDVYAHSQGDRYTFINGSGEAGLIVYDDGLWAYSNHGTDPVSIGGHDRNAFDLVRISLFHEEDEGKKTKDVNKLPSFKKMVELVKKDAKCREIMMENVADEFDDMPELDEEDEDDRLLNDLGYEPPTPGEFMEGMDVNDLMQPKKSLPNLAHLLANHPAFYGRIRLNEFSGELEWIGEAPFERRGGRTIEEADLTRLLIYASEFFSKGTKQPQSFGKDVIFDVTKLVATENAYSPMVYYFDHLPEWDGVKRAESVYLLLGSKKSKVSKLIMRKFFLSVIGRVYDPGCEAPNVLIFKGPQGAGKSYFFKAICPDPRYFSDSSIKIGDKDGYGVLEGTLITELGELASIKKSDEDSVKQFLSSTHDKYRRSYDRLAKRYPRQGVIVGSTNKDHFLTDATGNRRFKIIEITGQNSQEMRDTLTPEYRDQLWAEVKTWYESGEKWHYNADEEALTAKQAEKYEQINGLEDIIETYLTMKLPTDWHELPADEKRIYTKARHDGSEATGKEPPVQVVTIPEVVECAIGARLEDARRYQGVIAKVMAKHPEFKKVAHVPKSHNPRRPSGWVREEQGNGAKK